MEEISNPIKKKYKYAANYGFILGGYIAAFFILDYLLPMSKISNLIETLGLLGTPVVCYFLASNYRDKAWGGNIHFGQVWSFGIWLFLFASLLMAVLYYVRFQFLQPDYLKNAFNQTLILLDNSKLLKKEGMDQAIANGSPTAIQAVMGYIWFYIIGGAILFLLISPIISYKKPGNSTTTPDTTEKPHESCPGKNDLNRSQS